jgi:hypothetical protein
MRPPIGAAGARGDFGFFFLGGDLTATALLPRLMNLPIPDSA